MTTNPDIAKALEAARAAALDLFMSALSGKPMKGQTATTRVECVKSALTSAKARIDELEARATKAEAQLARAVEVIAPFAQASAATGYLWPDDSDMPTGLIKRGHVRAAAAFVKENGL